MNNKIRRKYVEKGEMELKTRVDQKRIQLWHKFKLSEEFISVYIYKHLCLQQVQQ